MEQQRKGFQMVNSKVLTTITCLACGLSYAINALFFAKLGNTNWASAVFATTAVTFETAKIIALTLMVFCFYNKNYKILSCSAVVYLVLFVVSSLASISVLNMNVQQNQTENLLSNDKYQNISRQIEIEQESIRTLQTSAAIDVSKGYRERSNGTIARIKEKQNHINNLYQQKQQIAEVSSTPALQYLSPQLMKIAVIFLGALLEFVTCYLLAIKQWQRLGAVASKNKISRNVSAIASIASTAKNTAVNDIVTDKKASVVTVATASPCACSDNASTQKQAIATVALLLQDGKLKPTTRAVRNYCACSTTQSCLILKALEQNSIVKRIGRGYAVA